MQILSSFSQEPGSTTHTLEIIEVDEDAIREFLKLPPKLVVRPIEDRPWRENDYAVPVINLKFWSGAYSLLSLMFEDPPIHSLNRLETAVVAVKGEFITELLVEADVQSFANMPHYRN